MLNRKILPLFVLGIFLSNTSFCQVKKKSPDNNRHLSDFLKDINTDLVTKETIAKTKNSKNLKTLAIYFYDGRVIVMPAKNDLYPDCK